MPELKTAGRKRDGEMEQGTRGAASLHRRLPEDTPSRALAQLSASPEYARKRRSQGKKDAFDGVRLGSNAVSLVAISARTAHREPNSPPKSGSPHVSRAPSVVDTSRPASWLWLPNPAGATVFHVCSPPSCSIEH
jgi:hypothetical protein